MSNEQTATKPKTGWWNPDGGYGRAKWHYVGEDGRTLCKRWLHVFGPIETGNDQSPDNCAKCRSLRAKVTP